MALVGGCKIKIGKAEEFDAEGGKGAVEQNTPMLVSNLLGQVQIVHFFGVVMKLKTLAQMASAVKI